MGLEARITCLAVDAAGSAYITGTATAAPLPVTAGAFQTSYQPATCVSQQSRNGPPPQVYPCPVAFAAKLNHDGTELTYLTYLGMANSTAVGIAVDGHGNAWIAGNVLSSDVPVTTGAPQPTLKGNQNLFLLKLNPAGSQVLFGTYWGGSAGDTATSLALDAAGNVYVAGSTGSADFPVTPGAFQTDFGGAPAVAKFDATGKPVYGTYFHGGTLSATNISAIAADSAGNAYLTGSHGGGSLPTAPGAFQAAQTGMRLSSRNSTRPDRNFCTARTWRRTAIRMGAQLPWMPKTTLTSRAAYRWAHRVSRVHFRPRRVPFKPSLRTLQHSVAAGWAS